MRVCGLKLTHDGAIAVIEDGSLLFSWELEKLNNDVRHAKFHDVDQISRILSANGVDPRTVDLWSIDGWGDSEAAHVIRLSRDLHEFSVAGYIEKDPEKALLSAEGRGPLHLAPSPAVPYLSFPHAVNHAMSAYASSPFAARGEDSLVLVWDGGMMPTLYSYCAADFQLRRVAALGPWYGNLYPDFMSHFGPFRNHRQRVTEIPYQLSLPGTAMAFAARGKVDEQARERFLELLEGGSFTRSSGDELADRYLEVRIGVGDDDVVATFQHVVGEILAGRLQRLIDESGVPRLCLSGGCALNIGWNSQIRTAVTADVWVPPFPNDSGVAIGAAAAALASQRIHPGMGWSVYLGPPVLPSANAPGWRGRACSPEDLGQLLARTGEPVVVLHGRAELGPRALGNRSILASPRSGMTAILNNMKCREEFRPVAPICLEDRAPEVFSPGTPDPYMIFVHTVRPDWLSRIPSVVHIDGSARLQTVTAAQNPVIARVLGSFEQETGLPVLCNTSANDRGRGFFPDARSAMDWGRTRYVWAEGHLFENHP